MSFSPYDDMKIEVTPTSETMADLVTDGLSRVRKHELAIRNVPIEDVRDAGTVINLVAEYVCENDVRHGERIGIEYPSFGLGVRLFDEGGGFKPFGRKPKIQAIADIDAEVPALPRTAMSNAALLKAAAASQRDNDISAAIEILQDAIARWPGEEGVIPEPAVGMQYNWQNALAYRDLASLVDDPAERARYLGMAVRRSAAVAEQVLGCFPDDLVGLDPDEVRARAHMIVMSHLDADFEMPDSLREIAGPTNTLVVTPLWSADEEEALLRLAMIPTALDELHLRRARRDLDLGPTVELLAKTFLEHIDDPVRLAATVDPSRELFADENAPSMGVGVAPHPADVLLSSLYAHIIRYTAVGDTELAVAALALNPSDEVRAATDKLELMEHDAFMSGLADMFDEVTDYPTRPVTGLSDPTEIRRANTEFLQEHGFSASNALPLPRAIGAAAEPGYPSGALRPAEEIARQFLLHCAVFAWGSAPEPIAPAIEAFIEANDLKSHMSAEELEIVALPKNKAGQLSGDVSWRLENMWSLAWLLGFAPEPSPLVGMPLPADVSVAMFELIMPDFDLTIDQLVSASRTPNIEDVIAVEDLLYCAHNAARSGQLGHATVPADFNVPLDGRAIAERRHAMTWALSPGTAWEETDLST